ncbi:MAG TPA: ATP-binding protein [Desulfomonilaceae bacterium]|nr:ATP-binding protein [Desulfomonilaceae bacterium]
MDSFLLDAELVEIADEGATETLDLNNMLSNAVSDSGSFDLRWIRQAAFGKLLDVMPVPALLVDEKYRITFANTACGFFSNRYSELNDATFSSLFNGKDQFAKAETVLERVFLERKPQVLEGSFRFVNTWSWGRMHVRAVRVRERKLAMVLVEDLTAETKRALINEKYKQLVKLLPVGIAEFAPTLPIRIFTEEREAMGLLLESVITDGNDEFARIHGFQDMNRLTGKQLIEMLPPEGGNKELYAGWIRSGFSVGSAEAGQHLPEGGERYVESTLIGLVRGELLLGFWLLKRDVTVSHKMKEDSFRAQKLESLGLLAGGIAHDFNNILTAILGNINLAKMSAGNNEKLTQRLSEAERGSWRAKDLTEQLLTFSRGGVPIKKVCALGNLLKESVAFGLRGSNVVPDFSISDDLRHAEIDEGQISQVINNLVINADQAMPDGGLLRVLARNVFVDQSQGLPIQDGEYVLVSVVDRGVGIPPEHTQRVFDPYFTTKPKGSGLGLATSYAIIKNHDGYISLESNPGSGSTFHVYLPASDKELPRQVLATNARSRVGGSVLIMDDEQMVRDVAAEMLTQEGYRVVCAKDGHEAIRLYAQAINERNPFDAVLIDLTIPGSMGGQATIEELLKIDPSVKTIVSSGYSNDPVMSHYRAYGFKGVVTKPYNLDELISVLAKVLNSDI